MERKAIVCVDDESIILESLGEQIRNLFGDAYLYEAAENAAEGMEVLDKLTQEKVDVLVIVSDWLMPGKKGDEFLKEVHEKYPSIIKVMLTGQADKEAIQSAFKHADLHACLHKPWSSEELKHVIDSGLLKINQKNNEEKQTILCVDDEEIIREALQEQLAAAFGQDYNIETSDSGEDALEFFMELVEEGQNVPVIISDYIMPGMKGDELLKQIHNIAPESLKILLTGQASIEGISNAINNAALYRYIAKPWDKDDLVLTVKEAIKSFLQEIKIRKQNKELIILNASLEEKVIKRTEELRLANASKDKFFSIIAHDLKSPFNALMGLSDILLENWQMLSEEDKVDLIGDINSSSKDAFTLVQNLLEWSRSQTGRIKVTPVNISPHLIIESNARVLSPHAQLKEITIHNLTDKDALCFGDENMISTVFRNLISNAIKFTHSGGKIEISSREMDGKVEYCIMDNGIGMNQETLKGLFDISSKVQRTGTNQETGTGLGLILCKEFIEKNRGTIRVESQKDQGSSVFLTIPMAEQGIEA